MFPGVSEKFILPDLGEESLLQSVSDYHDTAKTPGIRMDGDEVKECSEKIADLYEAGGVNWTFPFSTRDAFDQEFEAAFAEAQAGIKPTSGPGYPYRLFGDQNRTVLEDHGEEIKKLTKERTERIIFGNDDFLECSEKPVSWLLLGLRDPDRLFPKNQANPKRKPLPRVIAGASLVDQLVTRIFFGDFAEQEGAAYPFLPTKKGIGFSDEHAHKIGVQFDAFNEAFERPPVASDVAGWEKNFSEPVAELTRIPMARTMKSGDKKLFNRAFDWWKLSLLTNVAITDGGKLLVFLDKKVQRSGNLLTTTSNGIGRKGVAFCVGSVANTAGDDCHEWTRLCKEMLIAAYAAIGVPVRDVEQMSKERLVFCSHSFEKDVDGQWKCWLSEWERMLFEASRSKLIDSGTDLNWLKEVQHHPDRVLAQRFVDFVSGRRLLLGAVAGHDEVSEQGSSHL